MNTVKPELLGGFQDYLPTRMIPRQKLIAKIKEVYEAFGFLPLDTPCMERWNVLTGGSQDFDKSVFAARIVRGAEDRALSEEEMQSEEGFTLRFDLTVSLARVIAAYNDLPRPFKRYQIGTVWRGERPQRGRYREFVQFDIDTIGSRSMLADAEIVLVMGAVMKKLDITRFLIRINNRKILNGVVEMVGCKDRASELFRVIDKIGTLGLEGVLEELQKSPAEWSGALGLNAEQTAVVREFLSMGAGQLDLLERLRAFFKDKSPLGLEGVAELQEITSYLEPTGIAAKQWVFDPSVARGLGYYTGPVFETELTDAKDLGSVFSGGRFDGLTNRFIPDSNIPGVGASVGVDRLVAALEILQKQSGRNSTADVLVTVFGNDLSGDSIRFAEELRRASIKTELYVGEGPLRAQVAYATRWEIPFVIVLGPDEKAANKVALKDMVKRQQEILTPAECVAKLTRASGRTQ